MKKTVIALAVLSAAGVASAQTTVTMSGNIKGGIAATDYSGTAATSGRGLSVADGSSRLLIGGSEDLGGGMFAIFQFDTRMRVDDNGGNGAVPTSAVSSQLATGNTFLGLRGGFGTFQFGKLDSHYCLGSDSHGTRATALQASSCGLLGFVNGSGAAQAIANASRSTNMIRYTTPNMGGFQAIVGYSTAFQSTEGLLANDKGDARHLQVGYSGGPISVGASLWSAQNEVQSAGQAGQTVTANFNFGIGTVGLTYDVSKVRGASSTPWNKRTVVSVPVTFRLGAGTLLGTYSKAGDVKNTATVQNSGATLLSVGYEFPLSKRTSIGVNLTDLKNEAAAAYGLYTQQSLGGHGSGTTTGSPVAGQDQRQYYFGIRHAF